MPPEPGPYADPRDSLFDTSRIMNNLGRRAGQASIAVLLVSALRVLQQVASISIIARLIPPDEYGIFALAMPGVMMALALSNFGLPQAVIQRKQITHLEVSALFWVNVLFGTIATLVIFLLAGPAAAYFDEPRVGPVFAVVSLSVLFSTMVGQYQAIMRRTLRVRVAEYVNLGSELAAIAIAIVAALAGLSYWALVLQQISSAVIALIGMMIVTRWIPSAPIRSSFRKITDALSFGGFVAGFSIMNRMTEFVGTFVAGANFNSAAAGLFYRSRTLAAIPSRKIMVPLSAAFIPTFARLQDDIPELNRMFERLITRSNLLILPIAVLMATASEPLTLILLGPQWAAMAPLMFWISLFVLRGGANAGLQYILIAQGQGRQLFFYSLFRFASVATGAVLAAPHGVIAMTATYMLVELFITLPVMGVMALRSGVLNLGILWRVCLRSMLVAALMVAALRTVLMPMVDTLPAALQTLAAMAAIGVLYGIQVLMTPELRADALKVLHMARGKLARK